jgi:hypothetical protein
MAFQQVILLDLVFILPKRVKIRKALDPKDPGGNVMNCIIDFKIGITL